MPAEPRCPVCRRRGAWTDTANPARPFCSVRCRQVDLGRWLSGDYVISGDAVVDSVDPDGYPSGPASGGAPR